MNAPVLVIVPLGSVTATSTAPTAREGVVTVIEVEESTLTEVPDVPPKLTAEAPVRFVPVIVTDLPPAVDPEFGEMLVIVAYEYLIAIKP